MKVFIDGRWGTTGLQLEERLRRRSDVEILDIDQDLRKNQKAKAAVMDKANVIFLCLPDEEARASVKIAPKDALIIDASTAHRTDPDWAYGFPELSQKHRELVGTGKRISVPGCHACGFNALVYPLVAGGLIPADAQINCTSLTGYSGGGRSLIETYEKDRNKEDSNKADSIKEDPLCAPRPYALGLKHKHLPEMKAVSGLNQPPHFYPVVGDMAQGMLVTVHLWANQFCKTVSPKIIYEYLADHYQNAHFVRVKQPDPSEKTGQDNNYNLDYCLDNGFLDPTACNGTNQMELFVFGHNEQILLVARLDNLGKGASGAAVQCMNIACSLDERTELE